MGPLKAIHHLPLPHPALLMHIGKLRNRFRDFIQFVTLLIIMLIWLNVMLMEHKYTYIVSLYIGIFASLLRSTALMMWALGKLITFYNFTVHNFLSTNLILSSRNLDLIFDSIWSFEQQYKNQNHKNQAQSPFAPLRTVSTLKSSLSLSNLEKVLHIFIFSRLLSPSLLSLGSSGPQLSEWVVGPVWANLPSEGHGWGLSGSP